MTEHKTRHLPVVAGGLLVGLVSLGDLVKFRLQQQDAEIVQLVRYIQTGIAVTALPPETPWATPLSH